MPARTTASDRVASSPPTSCWTLPARRRGKLLELLDQGIVDCARHRDGLAFTALEQPQPIVQIVEGRHVLAVDIHQVILGRRGVACVQRRQRAVLMLQDQARDVRIVAGQHQLHRLRAHRMDRPDQVGEHVDIVDSDLQHHAARHARGLVAPRG